MGEDGSVMYFFTTSARSAEVLIAATTMVSLAVLLGSCASAGSAHGTLFPADAYQDLVQLRAPISHGMAIPRAIGTCLETGLGALDNSAGSGFERPLVCTGGAVTVGLDGRASALVDAAGFGFAAPFFRCGMRPQYRELEVGWILCPNFH